MTTRISAQGTLTFDPKVETLPFKPWWLILKCDYAWYAMYEAWLTRAGWGNRWATVVDPARVNADRQSVDLRPRLGLAGGVHPPAWGPHISVLRGERPTVPNAWGRYEGTRVRFEYDPSEIRYNHEYLWLPVTSPGLLGLREEMGLRRDPRMPLHLTIAHWK